MIQMQTHTKLVLTEAEKIIGEAEGKLTDPQSRKLLMSVIDLLEICKTQEDYITSLRLQVDNVQFMLREVRDQYAKERWC